MTLYPSDFSFQTLEIYLEKKIIQREAARKAINKILFLNTVNKLCSKNSFCDGQKLIKNRNMSSSRYSVNTR